VTPARIPQDYTAEQISGVVKKEHCENWARIADHPKIVLDDSPTPELVSDQREAQNPSPRTPHPLFKPEPKQP